MKKTKRTIFAAVMAVALVLSSFSLGVYAAGGGYDTITALLSRVTPVTYNGETQEFKNVNGETVYPILYEGTTYLPVRAVCNMLNIPVDYDADTGTVVLGTKPATPATSAKPSSTGDVTAADLVNNAIDSNALSVTVDFDFSVQGTYSKDGYTAPSNLIATINLKKDGNISREEIGQSLTLGEVFDVRNQLSYSETVDGITTTWTKDENGGYAVTSVEPAGPSKQKPWTDADFTGLTVEKLGDNYYVKGKSTGALQERMGIAKIIGAAIGIDSYTNPMDVEFVFDGETKLMKSATFTAKDDGNITDASARMEVSMYNDTELYLPYQITEQ